ncbi:MAG TPA: carboxypeptidase-like regulatory domain-containing protein, partial [Kofleriaceae bacterium]|nr:carboxypeptidase-like regulatory domain-containing protein [Kofleriaceae bacterium]
MRRILLAVGALVVIAVGLIWWLHGRGDHAPSKSKPTQVAGKHSTAPRPPAKPATVSGRVTRKSDGAGVAGAVVSLAGAEFGAEFSTVKKPTLVAITDDKGAWTAKDVPPGDYIIAATAKGLLPSARDKLTVASGEQRTGIDFALEAGGVAVRGTVSDVLGGPIASARVTARRQELSLNRDAEFATLTGADGTYELTLPAAEYRMAAAHDDYTRATKSIELEDKPVTADFTLIPGGVVRGQVIARDTGKPVPHAIVTVEPAHRSLQSNEVSAVSDDEGNFVVRGLSSGGVKIEARARGYSSTQPTTVQVGIGEDVDGVQVLVDGAFSISGRVV